MFPNNKRSLFAPFVAERARAISNYLELEIIAPCSYVPLVRQNVPAFKELFQGLIVYHPRYLGVPNLLWSYRWISYYLMCFAFWKGRTPKCDLVHIEWIYPDAYAFLRYAKGFHIKTVGVVHGNEAIGYFDDNNQKSYYIKALRMLDRIISVSYELKMKMESEYGIPEHKVVVIPNGVDLTKFPVINKNEARCALNIPTEKKLGVCVARLSEEKNLDFLVKAVSLLGNEAPEINVIGDGPLKNRLESMRQQYQVNDKFKLIGPVPHDKINIWLNAADFFCLPSQREGCPVVIHEALACGVPIVSTTVGAIPDLVCSDDYGILCPPSDAKALQSIIKKAIKKSWDRDKIATYGRKFTWDSVAQQTVKVYKEVLS